MGEGEYNYFESPGYIKKEEREEYNLLGITLIVYALMQNLIVPFIFILIGGGIYSGMFAEQPLAFWLGGAYFIAQPIIMPIMIAVSMLAASTLPFMRFMRKSEIKLKSLFEGEKIGVSKYFILVPVCMTVNMLCGLLSTLISTLFEKQGAAPLPTLDIKVDDFNLGSIILVLTVCIVGPILEEFIFRGVLFKVFAKKGQWFAIISSAFLFALTHANIPQMVNAFCLGIMFGLIAVKTGSIFAPIILHIINNSLAMAVSLFSGEQYVDMIFSLMTLFFIAVTIVAIFVWGKAWLKGRKDHIKPERVSHNGWIRFFTSPAILIYIIGYIGITALLIVAANNAMAMVT